MRKSGFTIGFLITALILVLFFILRGRSPFGRNNTSFSVSDITEITRIDLIKEDRKVTLYKDESGWLTGNGEETRKPAVLMLLRIVSSMEIKSPVSSGSFNSGIIEGRIVPVRVNVYRGRRVVKSYYVYQTPSNIYGNIMKVRVNSKPYIVYMPGYEGDIGEYFVADPLFWQPFLVFSFLPSEIRSVNFRSTDDPESSFRIEIENGEFRLADSSGYMEGWDTTRLKRYISYFTSISFERWASESDTFKADSVLSLEPLYEITLEKEDGGQRFLKVWEKEISEGDKKVTDTDRLWGEVNNNGQLFVIRFFDLDPLIKKKSYFFGN